MGEKGDCCEISEFFGGDKKTYCVKYDTEFDYERPDWNVYEKRINTKVGPDSMKTVCRNIKTGKIMEYTSTFSDRGSLSTASLEERNLLNFTSEWQTWKEAGGLSLALAQR